jgi:hypothetical protein
MWFWAALFIATLAYEIWAIWTKHLTPSQTVRKGPRWFKWALGIGLCGLIWHLFV